MWNDIYRAIAEVMTTQFVVSLDLNIVLYICQKKQTNDDDDYDYVGDDEDDDDEMLFRQLTNRPIIKSKLSLV